MLAYQNLQASGSFKEEDLEDHKVEVYALEARSDILSHRAWILFITHLQLDDDAAGAERRSGLVRSFSLFCE